MSGPGDTGAEQLLAKSEPQGEEKVEQLAHDVELLVFHAIERAKVNYFAEAGLVSVTGPEAVEPYLCLYHRRPRRSRSAVLLICRPRADG